MFVLVLGLVRPQFAYLLTIFNFLILNYYNTLRENSNVFTNVHSFIFSLRGRRVHRQVNGTKFF